MAGRAQGGSRALGLAAAAVASLCLACQPSRRPNVILFSVDSLRPDHLGCYGYSRETSPAIDRLAGEGTLFESAISSTSWTLPAHAALLTGLPDRVHGTDRDEHPLDESRQTLAESLRGAGYHTAGFFSGPFLDPSFGLSQGFDRYEDCTAFGAELARRLAESPLADPRTEPGALANLGASRVGYEDVTNARVESAVLAWLAGAPPEPFFLFVHFWDVHYDYIPPPPYDTMFDPHYEGPVDGRQLRHAAERPQGWNDRDVDHLRALYDGEIRWTDDTIGRITTALEKDRLLDRSILVLTADHGEAFYEHGRFGHRWTVYREEIAIPLVMRFPGNVPARRRVREAVSIVDVAPTILDLAGLPPLPGALGRTLVPLLRGATFPADTLVAELVVPGRDAHLLALQRPAWKAIIDLTRTEGNLGVFDLRSDPNETDPRGTENGPVSESELQQAYRETTSRLAKAAAALPAPRPRAQPIPKVMKEHLRSLGYVE